VERREVMNRPNLFTSVIQAIGDTPVVELSRFGSDLDGRILAKLEYLNPGFSKKDRIARQIIEDAEAEGQLSPGQTVVELTSGNTGTGLAIVCGVKGYPFVAVMSRGNSVERARMMAALGAEVVLVDQLPGSQPGRVSGGDLERVEQVTQRLVPAEERVYIIVIVGMVAVIGRRGKNGIQIQRIDAEVFQIIQFFGNAV
jgi:cysteine synthase A